MSWLNIIGHQPIRERFQRSFDRQRLASTYLFVGPEGVGKRAFALQLAKSLLCESAENQLESCDQCPACVQVDSQSHPDLLLIRKPDDKKFIPVELFIGDKEHRRQRGLCHDVGLKPLRGGRRIAIVDDADCMNAEGANSLLKTLEEPPPNSILILLGTSQQRQLTTIVSRCQVIRFRPLTRNQLQQVLVENDLIDEEVDLKSLCEISEGSVQVAQRLADPEFLEIRQQLFVQLASLDPGQDFFAKTLMSFVDAAGKETALKRDRLSFVGDQAITFFDRVIHAVVNSAAAEIDPAVQGAANQLRQQGFEGNQLLVTLASCIERTHAMQRHVFANASPANVVACWLSDLTRICRAERRFARIST